MRVMLVHPNYHSGGAEIAGTWPPAWVAYLAGYLKAGGYTDIVFVDAMTLDLSEDVMRQKFAEIKPDIVGCTAITPSIYKAQRLLQVVKEVNPNIVTVLGGIHATFMFSQVLGESPWIDAVVRGEGEQVFLNLVKAVDAGTFMQNRESVPGIAFRNDEGKIVSTPAEPPIQDLDTITPDWGILDWSKYIYTPLNVRGDPQLCAWLPVHLQFLQPVEVLARLPHPRSEEGGRRDRDPGARARCGLFHPGR